MISLSSASADTIQLQPSRFLLQNCCLLLLIGTGLISISGLVVKLRLHMWVVLTVSKVEAGMNADIRYGSLLRVDGKTRIGHRDLCKPNHAQYVRK